MIAAAGRFLLGFAALCDSAMASPTAPASAIPACTQPKAGPYPPGTFTQAFANSNLDMVWRGRNCTRVLRQPSMVDPQPGKGGIRSAALEIERLLRMCGVAVIAPGILPSGFVDKLMKGVKKLFARRESRSCPSGGAAEDRASCAFRLVEHGERGRRRYDLQLPFVAPFGADLMGHLVASALPEVVQRYLGAEAQLDYIGVWGSDKNVSHQVWHVDDVEGTPVSVSCYLHLNNPPGLSSTTEFLPGCFGTPASRSGTQRTGRSAACVSHAVGRGITLGAKPFVPWSLPKGAAVCWDDAVVHRGGCNVLDQDLLRLAVGFGREGTNSVLSEWGRLNVEGHMQLALRKRRRMWRLHRTSWFRQQVNQAVSSTARVNDIRASRARAK